MKYIADDGAIFKTSEECQEYEEKLDVRAGIVKRVEKYLSMREYKNDGARRRALTIIMSWIDYDMIDNLERDAEVVEPADIAVVRSVSES